MPIADIEYFISNYRRYIFGGIVLLACVLLLSQLGAPAFWDYDEATYAQVMRDTAISGDYLTLKSLGQNWFEKPPLYFWAGIAAGSVIPTKELAYRLPAALSGIASVIVVMLIAFEVSDSYFVAAAAGIILATSPAFVEAARQVRLDVPVTLAILFTLYSFVRGVKNEVWNVGIGVGLALGLLTKSVIGLFPIAFIALWALVYRDFSLLRSRLFWAGIALMLVIALPWHAYEIAKFGDAFWQSYIVHHVFDRAETNILAGGQLSNSLYLYFLATFAAPWTVVFLASLAPSILLKENKTLKSQVVLASFVLFISSSFFLAGTKIVYYLAPIYPFVALFVALMAWEIMKWSVTSNFWRSVVQVGAMGLVILGLANTIFVGFHYVRGYQLNSVLSDEERDVGRILASNPSPEPVYTYSWNYWESLRYYGNRTVISQIKEDQILDGSFFLIVKTEDQYQFPPELQAHLDQLYSGPAITLYKFTL